MVDADCEVAGGYCGHGAWDNVVGAACRGEAMGNDFIPMEEAGVVECSRLYICKSSLEPLTIIAKLPKYSKFPVFPSVSWGVGKRCAYQVDK